MVQKNELKMNFRYDINALRAIAIFGVLLFHYKIPYSNGGYSGVDVFFVISGYLMSRIIMTALTKDQFSFLDYYGKRLKRIAPALLILTLVLSILCAFFYLPEEYKLNERNAASSVLFLSNILYWKSSNYFDAASDTNMLLHTWSLSVEWQFYLIYPIILLGFNRIFKRTEIYKVVFILLFIMAFVASLVASKINPTASFYFFPTRAWEMLAGGIAFIGEGAIKEIKRRKWIALFGYIVIFSGFIFLDPAMVWPGVYTLIPVLATMGIIVANYNDFKILQHPSIQFIGKISYSLYLWHWPVYVIAQYLGYPINFSSALLYASISITLGFLSFKYVESIRLSSRKLIIITTVVFLSTLSLSYFTINSSMFKAKTLEIANYSKTHDVKKHMRMGKCFITSGHDGIKDFNIEACLQISRVNKNVLLLGDSHAAHFADSMDEYFKQNNINFLQATSSGDLPFYQNKYKEKRSGELLNYIFKDFLPKNAQSISGVIISANWAKDDGKDPDGLLANLHKTIKYLENLGIKVIVLGQSEIYNIPYTSIAAKEYEYDTKESSKYLKSTTVVLDKYLRTKLKAYYIPIINIDGVPSLKDGEPYIFDYSHYTKYGADLTIKKVFKDPLAQKFLKD